GGGLAFAADRVGRAETEHHALVDLDAVVELSDAVASAGTAADPSTEAFLLYVGASEGAPVLAARAGGIELADAVRAAGRPADAWTEAFLLSLGAAEGAPVLAAGDEGSHDEVQVLTAHAAAGREFDTGIVLDRP